MKIFRLLMALVAVASLAGFALAGEEEKTVTVTGKVVCAKCVLKKADAKECQNVLIAEVDGKTVEYYIAENKLSEEFGHTCMGEKQVIATGTVSEKDGKIWISPTKMDQPKG
jgi:uncharacterized protein YgiB involved in biofilm formation